MDIEEAGGQGAGSRGSRREQLITQHSALSTYSGVTQHLLSTFCNNFWMTLRDYLSWPMS
ncbi:MAG: hypothetical protein ACRAVC_00805 [Trichormus sp.]